MKLDLDLTRAEARAVQRAELSVGFGVVRSQALQSAERKLHAAVEQALADTDPAAGSRSSVHDDGRDPRERRQDT